MPLVNSRPIRSRPRSLSDTLDGNNSLPGACSALVNLIQDPSTPACLQCRPAAAIKTSFDAFSSPGVISVDYQSNNRIYGLIASARNAGKDEPFCYDLLAQAFITVSGITDDNSPTTQPTTGDWTSPTMSAVGQRVIVTHPGFVGSGNAFGYFDVSSFSEVSDGNITSGSNLVTGNIPIGAIGPGYLISGTGILANTTIVDAVQVTPQSTGTTTSGSPDITAVASLAGFAVGQPIAGLNIPEGSVITTITGPDTITISNNATATSSTPVTISATGTVITMSTNATATTTGLAITIAGGTPGAPLWAAGNTTNIQLPDVATNVNSFNNRPYFSVGQYLILCDPLTLNVSVATNVLTVGDTSPITALEPLTIINPATIAPVQGLLVFKEDLITLVTGDPLTGNFANNTLSSSGIGTRSQRAIAATNVGVNFIAVDGVRTILLSGQITDPLPDVRVPFINAINRTRMSAAYNAGIYRVALQNGTAVGTPWQEYWLDLTYKLWTGPHTFEQQMIVAWKNTFIAASNGHPAALYQTDPVQTATTNFAEFNAPLTWIYATSALPDVGDLMANSLVVSTLNCAFKAGTPSIQCTATDENGTILGQATLVTPGAASYWGSMIWGENVWFGLQYGLQPRQIPWTAPVVFSKLILTATAQSSLGFQISDFQALYQPLGYVNTPVGVTINNVPPPTPPAEILWDAGYLWDSGILWQ